MPSVFISYVRENSATVLRLADELRAYGIEVWLDKSEIKPGTRWADAIREAISRGDLFIACFSDEYTKRTKSYMNEELTLAIDELRQRPTDRAWFIPVLLSDCEVPNRGIGAGETLQSIQWVELYKDWNEGIRRIVSAIIPDAVWTPHELVWPDHSTMVVLPLRPVGGRTVCIGKYPVTNAQYKRFLEDPVSRGRGNRPPVGKHLYEFPTTVEWRGPFRPWREKEFNSPDKPVVCVSFADALAYCKWVTRLRFEQKRAWIADRIRREGADRIRREGTRRQLSRIQALPTLLPTPRLWNFAAFGTKYPSNDPRTWLIQSGRIHHNYDAPAPIDQLGERLNSRGISDMFGNVWEWCTDRRMGLLDTEPVPAIGAAVGSVVGAVLGGGLSSSPKPDPELRGGGFFDDLSKVAPFYRTSDLEDGIETRHSDLGFRISSVIDVADLPVNVRQKLSTASVSANSFL